MIVSAADHFVGGHEEIVSHGEREAMLTILRLLCASAVLNMHKIAMSITLVIVMHAAALADEIDSPEDLQGKLTLGNADYNEANPDIWTPVMGADLEAFLSHRWLGGVYIEKDTPLGQAQSALLLGTKGKRFTSQGFRGPLHRGSLSFKRDRYCVRWRGYGQLCYKVMAGELSGKSVHLITRENGEFWAGIELLIK